MIIVIHHNPQNNAVSLMFEGGPEEAVYQIMSHLVGEMEKKRQAQGNGRRPSGLIIPPTVVPKDIKKDPNA
jgi:hypothetical protein